TSKSCWTRFSARISFKTRSYGSAQPHMATRDARILPLLTQSFITLQVLSLFSNVSTLLTIPNTLRISIDTPTLVAESTDSTIFAVQIRDRILPTITRDLSPILTAGLSHSRR